VAKAVKTLVFVMETLHVANKKLTCRNISFKLKLEV